MSRSATRRTSPARGTAKPKRRVQKKRDRVGLLDHAVARLPGGEATARRMATWTITGMVVVLMIAIAGWLGLLSMVGLAMAEGIGEAGFRVQQIEITGAKQVDRDAIYRAVLDQKSRAMPLVDLAGVRQRLMDQGWVSDAQVSRRLPDTLVIRVQERRAAAIWQNNGQLMLIDGDGRPLESVTAKAMPALPVLVGAEANGHAANFLALMAAAPSLKPLVQGANWIGDRRWTLTFESGEQLLLPEGQGADVRALKRFVELDRSMGLLGHGYRRFDMREPGKLVILPANQAAPGDDGTTIEAPLADVSDGLSKA